MNIETLVAEVRRTLNAYQQGNFDYRPQFDSGAEWEDSLAAQFVELAETLQQKDASFADDDVPAEQYQTLFEQTKKTLDETKALHLASQSLRVFGNLPKMLEKIVDGVAIAIPTDTALMVLVKQDTITHMVAGGKDGIKNAKISPDEFFNGLGGWVLREKKPALLPKGKTDRRESQAVQRKRVANGVGSIMAVPIATHSEVLGVLFAMNSMDGRNFTEHNVRILSVMASYAANAIAGAGLFQQAQQEIQQRRKLEKALTKERDLLQALMDNVPDFIFFKDSRLHYVRTNTAHATTLLGLQHPHFAIGKTDFDFFPKAVAQSIYDSEKIIINTGKPSMAQEVEIELNDGRRHWFLEHRIPRKNSRGRVIGLVGISRDITYLKEVELMLSRRATELQTVTEVGTDISQILDTHELLQKVVDLTKKDFKLYHTHVYVLQEKILQLAAGAGDVGRQMVNEGWRIPLEREHSLVAHTARTGTVNIVNDVQKSPDYFQNPLLPDTRAEMAVPLMVGKMVLGVLDVQADAVDFFTEEDARVFKALGAQVAVALRNAELFSRVQATLTETEALYNISRALNTVVALPDLLKSVTDMVAESLGATWATLVTVDVNAKQLDTAVASGHEGDTLLPTSFDMLMNSIGGWALTEKQAALSPKGKPDSRESLDVQQWRLKLGLGAMVSVPLLYQNKPLGVLSAINPMHGRNFGQQDATLLVAVGNQVAAAIENRNLLLQTQKRAAREESIREVTEKLRAAPNLDILLQTAAEELGTRLGVKHSVLELGVSFPSEKGDSE